MSQYPIKSSSGSLLGYVELNPGHIEDKLDFALTPIVTLDVDDPRIQPEVAGFLASPRTELRTGVRSPEHPYRYLDPKLDQQERPQ